MQQLRQVFERIFANTPQSSRKRRESVERANGSGARGGGTGRLIVKSVRIFYTLHDVLYYLVVPAYKVCLIGASSLLEHIMQDIKAGRYSSGFISHPP